MVSLKKNQATGLSNAASIFGSTFDMNLIPTQFLLQADKFPYVC